MIRIAGAAAMMAGLAVSPAGAQGASTSDAAPPRAESYRSVFEGFRPFVETREADWVAANQRVRDTGGHGGALAEEDEEGAKDAEAAPSHAGHHR